MLPPVSDPFDGLSGTQVRRDAEGATLVVHRLGLEVLAGPDVGRRAEVKGTRVRVGTDRECDLRLTDPEVSRFHFEVRSEGDHYEVVDLDSTNGTIVDGVRVLHARLEPQAVIQVGGSRVVFEPKKRWETLAASSRSSLHGLVGSSASMRQLFGVLERVAPTELSVLIHGETGSGKEVVARAIHLASPRAAGPFLAVDCATIAPNVAESELFGHVRGAFTGAERDRRGVFEAASGGVVFLDEVGELPLALQPKLLRALERREVRPVGSNEVVGFDARIVAATHRDLARRVETGELREDLYFRLAEVTLEVPPLRARPEDLPELAAHLLAREGEARGLAPDAIAALAEHDFPGNVRELRNTLRRAAAFAAGPTIDRATIVEALRGGPARAKTGGFSDLLARPYREAREEAIARFERAYLDALMRGSDTVVGAAERAGIHRKSLERLLRKHGGRE